jgi:hypothetical protein
MDIQKYPVGHQDFKKIITNDFVYVDKTRYVHQLLEKGGYYFLSRPRRFGKSLFVSVLYYLFKGEKALFEGLYIADKWTFEEYPVIRISFSDIGYRTKGLTKAIADELKSITEKEKLLLSVELQTIDEKFKALIHALQAKYQKQVVILIDEYDKPIIDYLDQDQLPKARENRGILKSFYSILKDADPYLKLVFITGVSKFSQVSIFSDLNNLYDLSMKQDFNEICGISQAELEAYFPKELEVFDREKIRHWYNGYRWHIKGDTLYNPFSILNFFASGGDFFNYWYTTGTPTFLMDISKREHFYRFDKVSVSSNSLQSFDFENISLIPVLFQTGYLTIKAYQALFDNFILSFPNHEVEAAYLEKLADTYIQSQKYPAKVIMPALVDALQAKNAPALQETINKAFEHIPNPLWQKENEQFYHAIVHLLFSLMGVYINSEVQTKEGRADAIIQLDEGIFCLEFKLDKSAEAALAQIHDKGYLAPFLNKGKPCHAIGINFSKKKKEVEKIIWEEIGG